MIQIGNFHFSTVPKHPRYSPEKGHEVDVEGAIWMEHDEGEAWQLEGKSLARLSELLDQFWKDGF